MSKDVIQVEELRAAIGVALDQFVAVYGSEVVIRPDRTGYWHLWVEDAFDLLHKPAKHTIGDVSEDLAEIRQILAADDPYLPAWHTLFHVNGLLRYLEDAAR